VVETSGLELTGEYVGQTKTKVTKKLGEAKGGILFVNEAYELGKGHYGEEAMTTLLAAMTDPQYKLVIIMAGYPHEMNDMLDRNAGLKSRFTKYFDFKDWTASDCSSFLDIQAANESFTFPVGFESIVQPNFEKLIHIDGWANGRDVLRIWKDAKKYRTSEHIKTVITMDLNLAMGDMLTARQVPRRVKKIPPYKLG
jgi:hypothetical protein